MKPSFVNSALSKLLLPQNYESLWTGWVPKEIAKKSQGDLNI